MMRRASRGPTTYLSTSSVFRGGTRIYLSYAHLASLRAQTLYQTVSGMMNYSKATKRFCVETPEVGAVVWWQHRQAWTRAGAQGQEEVQVRCVNATILKVQQGRTREHRVFVAHISRMRTSRRRHPGKKEVVRAFSPHSLTTAACSSQWQDVLGPTSASSFLVTQLLAMANRIINHFLPRRVPYNLSTPKLLRRMSQNPECAGRIRVCLSKPESVRILESSRLRESSCGDCRRPRGWCCSWKGANVCPGSEVNCTVDIPISSMHFTWSHVAVLPRPKKDCISIRTSTRVWMLSDAAAG